MRFVANKPNLAVALTRMQHLSCLREPATYVLEILADLNGYKKGIKDIRVRGRGAFLMHDDIDVPQKTAIY